MRTAVHTGEVDLVEDDIRGIAIHEASRTLALAGGSQVLAYRESRHRPHGRGRMIR
jgi:class 3 adenylate cyclase